MALTKQLRKLKNKCWRLLSKKVRRERGNKCQFPDCTETKFLDVHHLEEKTLNKSLYFDELSLVVLCKRHHKFSREAVHRSAINTYVLLKYLGIIDCALSELKRRKYEPFEFTEEYLRDKLKELEDDKKNNGNTRSPKRVCGNYNSGKRKSKSV